MKFHAMKQYYRRYDDIVEVEAVSKVLVAFKDTE